jgi:MraZ protein
MDAASLPVDFKPLVGTDDAVIDDKGRILFSKKKRDRLGKDFAIVVTKRGCLAAYPQFMWRRVQEEVNNYHLTNEGRDQYTRLFFGMADDELNFDSQGRVVIPQKMREIGKLKKDVKLVGAYDRVEIWAFEEYSKFLADPRGYGLERCESFALAYNEMVGR